MLTLEQKLVAVEAKIKRWQSRLTRAANMLPKLDKQRRRLQAKFGPVNLDHVIGQDKKQETLSESCDRIVSEMLQSDTAPIPQEFKREQEQKPKQLKGEMPKMLGALLNPAAEINKLRLAKADAKRRGYPSAEGR